MHSERTNEQSSDQEMNDTPAMLDSVRVKFEDEVEGSRLEPFEDTDIQETELDDICNGEALLTVALSKLTRR
jgi:hypothetical protein